MLSAQSKSDELSVILVEDQPEWQDKVRTLIQESIAHKHNIKFQEYNSLAWSKNLRDELLPLILFLDLKLVNQLDESAGLKWLIENNNLLQKKPNILLYVVSAYLNELVITTLSYLGIGENHIYSKAQWTNDRQRLIDTLHEDIKRLYSSKPASSPFIDLSLQLSYKKYVSKLLTIDTESTSIPVLITASSSNWNFSNIPDLEILSSSNNIYGCMISYHSLEALKSDPNVRSIEPSRPIHVPEVHRSFPVLKIPQFHNKYLEHGDQAIIAFIDDGIDIFHKCFLDSQGNTRIVAIWDQTAPGRNRENLPFGPPKNGTANQFSEIGAVYTANEINKFLHGTAETPPWLHVSSNSHGTHVASIACGSACERFSGGVADKAQILFVKPHITSEDDLRDEDSHPHFGLPLSLMMAMDWIRQYADALELPVVVNISQGLNMGSHDGKSAFERTFDNYTVNGSLHGMAIVKSIGNERENDIHAKVTVSQNITELLRWGIRSTLEEKFEIQLWFESSDTIQFRLRDPNGNTSSLLTRKSGPIDGVLSGFQFSMELMHNHGTNGAALLHLVFTKLDEPLHPKLTSNYTDTIWTLEITGVIIDSSSGIVHGWIERDLTRPVRFLSHQDPEITLTIPGTSQHVITVGAIEYSHPDTTSIPDFASFGPTRDFREFKKPDVAAPSVNITGAASGTISDITTMAGSSSAAPHVTGAIALCFSRRAKQLASGEKSGKPFTTMQILTALRLTTLTGTKTWSRAIGYGVMNVEALMEELDSI